MRSATTTYRLGLAVALLTALFLVLGIGALGIIWSGGPRDLVFVGALLVGVFGTLLARLRAKGMAGALTATSAATVLAGVVALVAGWHRSDGASVLEILGLTGMYAALFALAALLFHRSGEMTVAGR